MSVLPAPDTMLLPALVPALSPALAPRRFLTAAELRGLTERLAGCIAADPSLADQLGGVPALGERRYVCLHRDEHVDVWLIGWGEEGDTGFHDHDISSGSMHVLAGVVVESTPRFGAEPLDRPFMAGEGRAFSPDHIHRMVGGPGGGVTVHAYSPPLERMGQYALTPDGVRRTSVSAAEELRPPQR